MSTINGIPFSSPRNINLKGLSTTKGSTLRFDKTSTTNTLDSTSYGLYVNNSGQLIFSSAGVATTIGAAGSSSSTMDGAYTAGRIVSVDVGALTLNGINEDTAVLSLAGDGDSGGALIAFAHTTATRNDLLGTGSTWKVTGQGAAEFQASVTTPAIVAYHATGNGNLTIDAKGSGTIGIGATSTGAVTITPALTMVASATITGTGGSDVFTVTAGDLLVSDGSLIMTDADNSVTLKVTNNTATTAGAAAATGVVEFASTSLTTGTLLHLELTEGTLNGGFYMKCWDITAGAAVFTIGENGDVVITGTADADALAITTGDFTMADGKVAITNQDNEDTLKVTNNGLTSASAFELNGSGTFTGSTTSSFVHISPTGLTTGTVAYVVANALTTGKVLAVSATGQTDGILMDVTGGGANITATGRMLKLNMGAATAGMGIEVTTSGIYAGAGLVTIAATAATTGSFLVLTATGLTTGKGISMLGLDALTSGIGLHVTSAATAITGAGRLAYFGHTGATSTSGTLFEIASAANDETIIAQITSSAALAAGVMLALSGASVTTGTAIRASDLNALTTGIGLHLASSATAITGAGRMVYVNHTGATGTSAILNEFASAANDETVIFKLTASAALAGGIVLDISPAALTTGKVIDISNLDAITTGKALHIDATGVTQTDGILVHIDSASTALTSTGRLLLVDHTGNAGVSAVIAEVASAAADETVIMKVTASAALAAGIALQVSGAAVTTGNLIGITNADALTTGRMLSLVSNSADTGTRSLAFIHSDNSAATGVTVLALRNDAPTSTNFRRMQTFSNGTQTVTFWMSDGSTSPNTALTGTAGDVCYGADSGKTYYCTGTTNWTAFA